MKILFIHDNKYEVKDGLWAALNLLEKDGFEVERRNLNDKLVLSYDASDYDFVLGWGAFSSSVDNLIQGNNFKKTGLCIGGTAAPPIGQDKYDVLFYETDYYLPQIQHHKNVVHAFGVNIDIYKPVDNAFIIWDWLTVGAFARWKRQEKLLDKGGYRLAIGEIQKENIEESGFIITTLITNGITISDMVEPEKLNLIYNASAKVYIPADTNGGGERAVLEARACGKPVEVEFDNPKLYELTKSPIWDQYYYFDALKRGINSCF